MNAPHFVLKWVTMFAFVGFYWGATAQVTWYSLNSGDWDNASNWTLDPAGAIYLNPDNTYPFENPSENSDNVVIRSGDEMVVPDGVAPYDSPLRNLSGLQCGTVTINGVMDLRTSSGHSFSKIRGGGRLYLSGDGFPAGDATHFVSQGKGEGTVVLKGSSFVLSASDTLFNVEVDMSAGEMVNLDTDFVLNGNLIVKNGTIQMNNGGTTVRNFTINGDVLVYSGATFSVSSGNANHWLNVYGDFINNGTVDFSNTAQYTEASDGAVKLKFLGATDNDLNCNGTTDLYRLFLDKGTDTKRGLSVNASSTANFKLFGPVSGTTADVADGSAGWERLPLVLTHGTLKLESNIVIETLGENRYGDAPKEFSIPLNSRLWINGAAVTTSTSTGDQNGLTLFGSLTISAGTFTTPPTTRGISYGTSDDAASELKITGGSIHTTQLRPYAGATKFSFVQTGGELHLNALTDDHWSNPIFYMPEPTLGFDMSGGEIIFSAINSHNVSGIYIAVAEGNYHVTGGVVEVQTPTLDSAANDFKIYSTIPLYDLTLSGSVGTQSVQVVDEFGFLIDPSSLTILNDFTIGENTTFDDGGYRLTIGGDFSVAGTFSDPGDIIMNGNSDVVFTNTSGSTLAIGGLTINKGIHPSPGDFYTVSLAGSDEFEIDGTLRLTRGAFDVVTFDAAVTDSIVIVDGDLTPSDTGAIVLSGTSQQVLQGKVGANQNFGRLLLDNSSASPQVKLASDVDAISVCFNQPQIFMLDIYNLELDSADYAAWGWATSSDYMFQTAGAASNGGLTLPVELSGDYGAETLVQLFPLRTSPGYSPVGVYANDVLSSSGKITVKPVNTYHHAVDDQSKVVQYFWKIFYDDLSGITSSDLRYRLFSPVTIAATMNASMVFYDSKWEMVSGASESNETIDFPFSASSFLEGEYTQGNNGEFANSRTLYSIGDGNFNVASTWSLSSHTGNTASSAPALNDVCVIGGANGFNHTVTISADNADAAHLSIKGKSDTGIGVGNDAVDPPTLFVSSGTSGHDIESINGEGIIVYENNSDTYSAYGLINGDHSDFCRGEESIIEYTGSGTGQRIIPISSDIPFYSNLRISGSAGQTQTDDNLFLMVHGNLEVESSTLLLDGAFTETVTVLGDVIIDEGTLTYEPVGTRNMEVEGDIIFTGAGTFNATTGGAENLLNLHGDITLGSGAIDFGTGGRLLTVYFHGDSTTTYSSDSNAAEFYRVKIAKTPGQKVHFTSDFNLNGATDGTSKALELLSGECHLDNPDILLDLSSGGDDFTIPSTVIFRVDSAQVNVGGATDDAGVCLDGSLIVDKSGKFYCNQGSGGYTDNYLRYSASGYASIWVGENAELLIGSQLRRPISTDAGILSFTQNAASSIIKVGINAAPTNNRGVFEIFNTGSSFSQVADANITIVNGQGSPTVAALQFNPDTVTLGVGAGFILGDGTTTNTDIGISAGHNLMDLAIEGSNIDVDIWCGSASFDGDVTIGVGDTLFANGCDLYFNGDLTIDGAYSSGSNTTYFMGEADQSVTGSTSFYNLVKQTSSSTLTLQASSGVTVLNDFTLSSGVFNTGANDVQVRGNFINNATTSSSGGSQGIVMNGVEDLQNISGTGVFGRLTVDNSYGVVVPSLSLSLTISEFLKLEDGVFDIGRNMLVLSKTAEFEPGTTYGGEFSSSNMVQTNLSFTDGGIKKLLPGGATSDFIYPVGSYGKYTPVFLDVTGNGNDTGSLRVKAANERHVTIVNDLEAPDPEIVDTANVLDYNWTLDADGISGLTGTVKMKCDVSDILLDGQVVTDYITARFASGSDTVYKFTKDDFIEDDTLRFHFSNVSDGDIDGDYTAGIEAAIPGEIPAFISVVDGGNWNDASSWAAYNPVTEEVGLPGVAGVPSGAIVYIDSTVNIVSNSQIAFRTQINPTGKLVLGTSINHRLGDVVGTGQIVAESGSLPAGIYDAFFSSVGGTIEYSGSGDYSILSQTQEVNNIVCSGSGERHFPNYPSGMTVHGDFTIDGATAVAYSSQDITIGGDFTRTSGVFTANSGKVVFGGSGVQNISGSGFTSANSFYDFEIANGERVNINCDVEVEHRLWLTDGVVDSQQESVFTLTNSSDATVTQAVSTSYIDGALRKNILASGDFQFPVGKSGRVGDIKVTNVSGNGYWLVEYFNQNPSIASLDPSSFLAPLDYVTLNEYWLVKSENALTASVTCSWDDASGMPSGELEREKWRLVEWKTAPAPDEWQSVGSVFSSGHTQASGTITLDADAAFNEVTSTGNYFAFGTSSIPEYTWEGDDSTDPCDWFVAENWSGGIVPSASSDVTIVNVTNAPVVDNSTLVQVNNLTINSGATLVLEGGSQVTVNGDLTTNNGLSIQSSITTPASFINYGTITGNVNVEWTYPDGRYFYIGHAVNDITYTNYSSVASLFKLYRYSVNSWSQITSDTDLDGKEEELEGYIVKFQDGTDVTVSYTGVLRDDLYSLPINGWHLIANPYPAYINSEHEGFDTGNALFSVWTSSMATGSLVFATYNRATNVGANGGTPYIAPGQSFWIRNYSPSTFQLNPLARVHDTGMLKSSSVVADDVLRLELADQEYSDELVLVFRDGGTMDFSYYDSEKLLGPAAIVPNVYALKGNKKVVIGLFPEADVVDSIYLGYKFTAVKDIRLKATNLCDFCGLNQVYLLDRLTNVKVNLRLNPDYSFTSSGEEEIDRFVLLIERGCSVPTGDLDLGEGIAEKGLVRIYADQDLSVEIDQELLKQEQAKVELFDLGGRLLMSKRTSSRFNKYTFDISLLTGLVKVTIGENVFTEKVVFGSD